MGAISHTPMLLKTHTLDFIRPAVPQLNAQAEYDIGDDTLLEGIVGSRQPIRAGMRVRIIPEGYDTTSGYFFYTKEALQGYKEGSQQLPDYAVIDGREYEVHNIEGWGGFGLNTDHNKYILVARAQKPND